MLRIVGRAVPDRAFLHANYAPGCMTMVGEPSEIADRIIAFQRVLGHSRQILQMDLAGILYREVLRSIELLGTSVAPKVRTELGRAHLTPDCTGQGRSVPARTQSPS